jgi:hypothetical protein
MRQRKDTERIVVKKARETGGSGENKREIKERERRESEKREKGEKERQRERETDRQNRESARKQ